MIGIKERAENVFLLDDRKSFYVLAGVAQWIERRPANQSGLGTGLGCGPGLGMGVRRRQPASVSLPQGRFSPCFALPLPSLKINKIFI